ncbi:Protein HelA [Durusdinium trenchii]|uniref:Protein HelA n=1 Tax=Durusdinium trenchii TaxID=1381693 RepID=A0ABP0LWB3_9DINO
MVGFISLAGIASRNGILLLNHYLHLVQYEGEDWTKSMIVRAGLERLAPVLMTALTSGIGLVPLVLAADEPGKEILYPVATVILGGLISSTLLDFFVHPALFWLFGLKSAARVVSESKDEIPLDEHDTHEEANTNDETTPAFITSATRSTLAGHHKKELNMTNRIYTSALMLSFCLALSTAAWGQSANESLQATLEQAAKAGKFTFIVFHRDTGNATRSLYQQTQDALTTQGDRAVITTAPVDAPQVQAYVEKFGISRAPMPMTVAVAPNGALTGLYPRTVTPEQITAAIVPPTMMRCMKELQDQKLVFVCFTRTDSVDVPQGVNGVRQLPQFKDRISLVGMRLDDPAEARFYQQMQVDPNQIAGPHAVLIAPPGVLVGQFNAQASTQEIAAAIHKAGQCCDDPNCKHNHAPQATRPAPNAR